MAVSCANCPADARYRIADSGANPVDYCARCLPPHEQRRATHFADPNAEPPKPAPKPRASRKRS